MRSIILKFPFGYLTIILAVITISLLIIFEEKSKFNNYLGLLPAITMISFLIFWILRPFRKYYINSELEISTKKKVLLLDLILNVFLPLICVGIHIIFNWNLEDGNMTNTGLNVIIYFLILTSLVLNWIVKKVFMKIK